MTSTGQNNNLGALLRLATFASVFTACLLISVKLYTWVITGSLSILASLIDSTMDAAASLINLIAVRYALKSPDEEHQFGHGKAESLAGLGQASFIMGSAVFLIIQGVERLSHPHRLKDLDIGIAVMAFAMAATLGLLLIQRHVIRRTNSTAIKADALHYASDLLTNTATIAALGFSAYGMPKMDPILAIGIAVFIMFSACRIAYDAAQSLMDRQLPPEIQNRICDIALAHEKVLGVHGIRTRASGPLYIIQLHLVLYDTMPLNEAHQLAKDVERQILQVYPNSDIIIHQDPMGASHPDDIEATCPDRKSSDKKIFADEDLF